VPPDELLDPPELPPEELLDPPDELPDPPEELLPPELLELDGGGLSPTQPTR